MARDIHSGTRHRGTRAEGPEGFPGRLKDGILLAGVPDTRREARQLRSLVPLPAGAPGKHSALCAAYLWRRVLAASSRD